MLESEVPVYLENTAGGDNAVARRFDALAKLWDAGREGRSRRARSASASTPATPTPPARSSPTPSSARRQITGRLDLLHANDSRDPAGTGADRHANLGKGKIDPDALRHMIAAADCPIVVETPRDPDDLKADIDFVRDILAEG